MAAAAINLRLEVPNFAKLTVFFHADMQYSMK